MLRTRDGYRVTMPRFRVRRLRRPLARFPVFGSRIGTTRVELVTRAIGPWRVELLYIRRVQPAARNLSGVAVN